MATVTVYVKDQLGQPIQYASITLKGTKLTDGYGKAVFYSVKYGTYTVTITK